MRLLLYIIILAMGRSAMAFDTYYISNAGNNNASGKLPAASWKNIKEFKEGNTYLFAKGDTFSTPLPKIVRTNSGQTLIGSYGAGAKPVLNFYKQIKAASWTKHSANIWKAQIDPSITDYNVGFLKKASQIYGSKFKSVDLLKSSWDFCSDKNYVYVWHDQSPGMSNADILASINQTGISLIDNMTVSDVKIIGVGGHAISGANCKNVAIRGVDIEEIGGSFLVGYSDGTVRYGNGIQFFNGSQDCVIENCTIKQVYDAGITMQGDAADIHFSNMIFRNNVLEKNEQSFEIWVRGGGPGFTGCKFINNQCIEAGLGWSHSVRPDQAAGVHILCYALEMKNSDLVIENNVFDRAYSGLYYHLDYPNIPKFVSRNNTISLSPRVPLRSVRNQSKRIRYDIRDAQKFVNATGYEKGSTFKTLPGVSP